MKLTGITHAERIWEILINTEKDHAYIGSEWAKRKGWFDGIDGGTRLKSHLIFFRRNRSKILESIRTGVPIYELKGINQPAISIGSNVEEVAGLQVGDWSLNDYQKMENSFYRFTNKKAHITSNGLLLSIGEVFTKESSSRITGGLHNL